MNLGFQECWVWAVNCLLRPSTLHVGRKNGWKPAGQGLGHPCRLSPESLISALLGWLARCTLSVFLVFASCSARSWR